MTDRITLLRELEAAVSRHNDEALNSTLDAALNAGISLKDIRLSIILGLDQVRGKLMSNDASIPDFLLCLDRATDGLHRLTSLKKGRRLTENDTPLVIGVVEGDPHSLGKNMIASIYRTCGYRVSDLGLQVPEKIFIKKVREKKARVLALSAMMSTTMSAIPGIIKGVKEVLPGIVVMVGGAPLDEALAMSYGADGYAETAVTVLEETEAAIRRASEGNSWPSLN